MAMNRLMTTTAFSRERTRDVWHGPDEWTRRGRQSTTARRTRLVVGPVAAAAAALRLKLPASSRFAEGREAHLEARGPGSAWQPLQTLAAARS